MDIKGFDELVIDPQLRLMTQLGIERIERSKDTYCPGTLPPQLYQATPFSKGDENSEIGVVIHQLTSTEVALTTDELQAMADEEAEDQALSQAIDTFIATTRAGRTARASEKVLQNREKRNGS